MRLQPLEPPFGGWLEAPPPATCLYLEGSNTCSRKAIYVMFAHRVQRLYLSQTSLKAGLKHSNTPVRLKAFAMAKLANQTSLNKFVALLLSTINKQYAEDSLGLHSLLIIVLH